MTSQNKKFTGVRVSFIGQVTHPDMKNGAVIKDHAKAKGFHIAPTGSVFTHLCVVKNLAKMDRTKHALGHKMTKLKVPMMDLDFFVKFLMGAMDIDDCPIIENGGTFPPFLYNHIPVENELFGIRPLDKLPESDWLCI